MRFAHIGETSLNPARLTYKGRIIDSVHVNTIPTVRVPEIPVVACTARETASLIRGRCVRQRGGCCGSCRDHTPGCPQNPCHVGPSGDYQSPSLAPLNPTHAPPFRTRRSKNSRHCLQGSSKFTRTRGSKRCLQALSRGHYGFLQVGQCSSVCMNKPCGRFLVCEPM